MPITRTTTYYRATDASGLFDNQPVIFFVHGGAWVDGYRGWYEFISRSRLSCLGIRQVDI